MCLLHIKYIYTHTNIMNLIDFNSFVIVDSNNINYLYDKLIDKVNRINKKAKKLLENSKLKIVSNKK